MARSEGHLAQRDPGMAPTAGLAYEQEIGRFRFYRHEYSLRQRERGRQIIERVSFLAPGGSWVGRLVVAPELRRIFVFRRGALNQLARVPSAARRRQPVGP